MPQELFIGAVMLVLIVLFCLVNLKVVDDPDIGLVKHLGKLQKRLLLPGPHLVWQIPLFIDQLIIVPGGEMSFDVPVDNIVTHNVPVRFNAHFTISINRGERKRHFIVYPDMGASIKFVTWLERRRGREIIGRYVNGEYLEGILDEVLRSIIQDAAESVVKRFRPELITASEEAHIALRMALRQEIARNIKAWGTVEKVLVQDISVDDENIREKVRRDAIAEKDRIVTQAQAQVATVDTYIAGLGERRGEKFATINAYGDMLGKARNVDLHAYGPNVEDILKGIINIRQMKKNNRR